MIKVSHLFYDYPNVQALNDVSFSLPKQSITALVGPNGAGKTTLLRSMAALDEPTSGKIIMNGLDVWESPREAHIMMGYLPDHFGLYQQLCALQCLTYAAWSHGLRGSQAQKAVLWAAQQVNITSMLAKPAGTLSRGQRQRLALAQAIVHRPKVLLMDEPASGLDPEARASLSELMKNLAQQGMTLLISSHILAELETYCTAMLVLEKGEVLAYEMLGQQNKQEVPPTVLRIKLITMRDDSLQKLCAWLNEKGCKSKIDGAGGVEVQARFKHEQDQAQLLKTLLDAGWPVMEYASHAVSLQDVYMQAVSRKKQVGEAK